MGFEGGLAGGGGSDEAHAVWEKKYIFVKKMVPGFVSEEFAKKVCILTAPRCPGVADGQIFSTGRSLNFIRYSCRDSDWIETQAKLANAGRGIDMPCCYTGSKLTCHSFEVQRLGRSRTID